MTSIGVAKIDWEAFADSLGTITRTEDGWSESGGGAIACEALSRLVGDEALRDAVDFYLARLPGSELARSVLRLLRPQVARDRCIEIFRTSTDPLEVGMAIDALSDVVDTSVIEWLPEIQASRNSRARTCAVRVLDQLYMAGFIEPDDGQPFLDVALADEDETVRQSAANLLELWAAFEHGEPVE